MKFTRLHIEKYGHFTKKDVVFGPRLTVVGGANEVGKTTLLNAMRDMLYGVPLRSVYAHSFGRQAIRITAEVSTRYGKTIAATRTNRRVATKESGELGELQALLGEVSLEQYRAIFGITLHDLQQGALRLQEAGLEQVLAGSALGGAGDRLSATLATLTKRMELCYKPQGSIPKVNALKRRIKELESRRKEGALKMVDFKRLQKQVVSLKEHQLVLEKELKSMRVQSNRSLALANAWRAAQAQLRELRSIEALGAMEDGPSLSSDELGGMGELLARTRRAEDRVRHVEEEMMVTRRRLDGDGDGEVLVPVTLADGFTEWNQKRLKQEAAEERLAEEREALASMMDALDPPLMSPLPTPREQERWQEEWLELQQELREARRLLREREAELADALAGVEAMARRDVVRREELMAARARRDELWGAFQVGAGSAAEVTAAQAEVDRLADRLIDQAQLNAEVEQQVAEVAKLERLVSVLRGQESAVVEAFDQWELEWRQGPFARLRPDQVDVWLGEAKRITLEQQRLARREGRLQKGREDLGMFADELATFLDMEPGMPWSELHRRFRHHFEQSASRKAVVEQWERQLASQENQIRELKRQREEDAAEVSRLMAKCGVREVDDLEAAATTCREWYRLAERCDQRREEHGEILDDPALMEHSEEELRAEVDRLVPLIRKLEEDYQQTLQAIGETEKTLADCGSEEQAWMRAEIESLRAEQRVAAEEYVRLAVARSALQRSVERFRRENEPALFALTSRIFTKLTGSDYTRVFPDPGKVNTIRVEGPVAPTGKNVEELSTGAREQLFLAIRLAYVVQYAEENEPLPVILDDAIVNFDDVRSRLTLETLTDLHPEVQVVVLSCHGRVLEDAAGLKGSSVVELRAGDADVSENLIREVGEVVGGES